MEMVRVSECAYDIVKAARHKVINDLQWLCSPGKEDVGRGFETRPYDIVG